MTEVTDSKASRSAGLPGAGEQLKEARESRNLTIQQVAQALHLDPWILEALEQNRFRDVGAPVFVKGHLRKYAAEVGLDAQAVMEAYYRADDAPETPVLVTDTFARSRSDEHGRWPIIVVSALLALLLVIAVLSWFGWAGLPGFLSDSNEPEAVGAAVVAAPPASISGVFADSTPPRQALPEAGHSEADTGSGQSDSSDNDRVTAALTAVAEEPARQADEQEARPDNGMVNLSITLQDDSWMEIYDAGNQRLFFDLARAGATSTVSGRAPLQVLLGNADDARVRVNGEVWPIPAAARRGKTARFTIR